MVGCSAPLGGGNLWNFNATLDSVRGPVCLVVSCATKNGDVMVRDLAWRSVGMPGLGVFGVSKTEQVLVNLSAGKRIYQV